MIIMMKIMIVMKILMIMMIKKTKNQLGRGRPPPPPLNGQCLFKNVFSVWTPSLIRMVLQIAN